MADVLMELVIISIPFVPIWAQRGLFYMLDGGRLYEGSEELV